MQLSKNLIISCLIAFVVAILPLCKTYATGIGLKLPVNILYIIFAIFIIYHYKNIKLQEFKAIFFPIACLFLVILMAYISLYWTSSITDTMKYIRQFLLEPSLFMIFTYLIVKRLNAKELEIFFVCICVAALYHPIITIYDFFVTSNGVFGYRATLPRYGPATIYTFYLLFAFGISLAGLIFARRKIKIIFFVFLLISSFAFVCTDTRFGFLAAIAMLLCPFVFLRYKYKKYILFGVLAITGTFILMLYYVSGKWSERYNFKKMIDNFSLVWSYAPAEMGIFTDCNTTEFICSSHSINQPKSPIQWEYSSLVRISLAKSTLLAIAQNPFRPNGYHFWSFPTNIQHIFPLSSPNHPFSLIGFNDTMIAKHIHNHNYILSLWFELGIFGLLGVCGFLSYIYIYIKKIQIYSK